jgi:hypothetical protein
MPSHMHEALIELFRHRPSLVAELLTDPLGVDVPPWRDARLDSGELTDLTPTEYRADAVVTLSTSDKPRLAVVIEVQLGRDPSKRRSWPVYLATLHARLRCSTVLLVLCADAAVAEWCARPISLGHPGWVLTPLVLGPEQVPVVTDADRARDWPELAVLSAMAHGARPERDKIFHALLEGLAIADHDHSTLYADVVLAALPEAARRQLEALMTTGTYEYQSEFARRYFHQGRAEGEAKGEAKAVLSVLSTRGIEVPDDARRRIMECTDVELLDVWVRRAITADSVDDLFD